jgi:hypothetical protein
MAPKNSQPIRRTSPKLALPRFNSALGKFLALPAHLEQKYSDVVTQIYPLKASMTRLQEFCDGYLNLDENSPIRFRPAAPWVLMQVVDYGKMASSSRNVGWFSQHELAFGVPLQCHKKENGKWVLADWAMVYPFIFVDNPLSMSGGREIYGWSKAGIRIEPTLPIIEPGNARRLVSISLVTSGAHFREASDLDEFLQIFQRRPFLSATSAVSDVFTAIPRAIASSIAAAYSVFESTGFFPFGYADRDLQSLQEVLSRLYGQLNAFASESFRTSPQKGPLQPPPRQRDGATAFNIVTMKQVRDVGSSPAACFQAIVGSKMQIERTTDGGYLFDPLSGDTSGGIYINLLNTAAQPIVQALGIQTNEYSSVGGKPASTLRPLAPFWLKMDLRYGLADYQYWRTHTTEWTLDAKPNNIASRTIPYLGTGSGASEELYGPYHFPHITFRVLPLRSAKKKLQNLIDNYLKNDFFDFEVAGHTKDSRHSIVCLVATNFEEMTAAADPDNNYSDCELTFAVPVLWWDKKNAGIKQPALVPVYTFTGTDWNAATSYEVYGRLALKSDLINPDIRWLEDLAQPSRPDLLLTVKTELFPKLGQSQEAQKLKVVEIFSASGGASQIPIAAYLKQLGLEHFWNGTTFHSIALKQIMNAQDPEFTNYQALVGLGRSFSGIEGRKPAVGTLAPLSINVHDYSTFPIVEMLGLLADKRDTSGLYPISTLTPIDPFWISGAMEGDAGHEMCWRVGTVWERNPVFDETVSGAAGNKPTPTKRKKK